jgi:hypothetical protein
VVFGEGITYLISCLQKNIFAEHNFILDLFLRSRIMQIIIIIIIIIIIKFNQFFHSIFFSFLKRRDTPKGQNVQNLIGNEKTAVARAS